ncbi:MAG: TetR/AcrR family transcriptional regulator [Gluconacetobacter diazotrophicus]|nr:TetR/AcrR family transcriptional regulator [Gluconacetobacter diazotrophicus]
MNHTDNRRPRGRPRSFDPDQAVAIAQRLFHARGFDAVSVAELTAALNINPPSFYAAFGSKAELYARILDRYAMVGAIPLRELLATHPGVAEGVAAVLEEAARRYAADPAAAGCLVIEGARCVDPGARNAACGFLAAAEDALRRHIATAHPDEADRLTDFVCTVMAGMSANARNGHDVERLLATARLAAAALGEALRA